MLHRQTILSMGPYPVVDKVARFTAVFDQLSDKAAFLSRSVSILLIVCDNLDVFNFCIKFPFVRRSTRVEN